YPLAPVTSQASHSIQDFSVVAARQLSLANPPAPADAHRHNQTAGVAQSPVPNPCRHHLADELDASSETAHHYGKTPAPVFDRANARNWHAREYPAPKNTALNSDWLLHQCDRR